MAAKMYSFAGSMIFTRIILILSFILVLVATLAQIPLGIYEVQQKIFNSWFGGRLLVLLFSINLVASMIQRSGQMLRPLGFVIGHIGLLILLFGGFTDIFANFYIFGLWEGQESNQLYASGSWSLVLRDDERGDLLEIPLSRRNHQQRTGQFSLNDRQYNFTVEVMQFLVNVNYDSGAGEELVELPWENSASANLPFIEAKWRIASGSSGSINLWAGDPQGESLLIPSGDSMSTITAYLRPVKTELPFSIRLESFTAEYHPDTDIPQGFRSNVTIVDGTEFPALIEMNQPLRYRGYVFYQSSFQQDDSRGKASVFTVQETTASFLPYLATFISLGGFILHYLSRGRREKKGGVQ